MLEQTLAEGATGTVAMICRSMLKLADATRIDKPPEMPWTVPLHEIAVALHAGTDLPEAVRHQARNRILVRNGLAFYERMTTSAPEAATVYHLSDRSSG